MRLHALIVEDEDADELLLLRALAKEGFEVRHRRVENRGEMIAALAAERFDVIFCDWRLPEFGAMAAIEIATKHGPGIPILIVSGSIGEEAAVEALRAGATDFVNKDKLSRLGPAIRRELRDAATRRSRERLERQMVAIFENSMDAMLLADDDGRFVEANPAACELLGVERERLVTMHIGDIVPSAPGPFAGARTGFVQRGRESGVVELRRADERLLTVEYNAIGEVLPGVHLSVLRDVTERQQLRARLALADRLA
ncbi:MAG TPA: response regulator, partial [Nannocystaceae bacterium]|nr:response regulator [Nannocystaceae bacterium]